MAIVAKPMGMNTDLALDPAEASRMMYARLVARIKTTGGAAQARAWTKLRREALASGRSLVFREFKVALSNLGIPMDAGHARACFNKIDADHSGDVTMEEFLSAFAEHYATSVGATVVDSGRATQRRPSQSLAVSHQTARAGRGGNGAPRQCGVPAAKTSRPLPAEGGVAPVPTRRDAASTAVLGGRAHQLAMVAAEASRPTALDLNPAAVGKMLYEKLLIRTKSGVGGAAMDRLWKKLRIEARSSDSAMVFEEFETALSNLGIPVDRAHARACFNSIDHDHSGDVSIVEFLSAFTDKYAASLTAVVDSERAHQLAMVASEAARPSTLDLDPTAAARMLYDKLLARTKSGVGGAEMERLWKKLRHEARSSNNVLIFAEFETALANLGVPIDHAHARACFDAIDEDDSGDVSIKEFLARFTDKYAATLPGFGIDSSRARQLAIVHAQRDGNLDIAPKEAAELLYRKLVEHTKSGKGGEHERLWKQLRHEARSADNVLTLEELDRALRNLGISMDKAHVKATFEYLDANVSGDVEIKEFLDAFHQQFKSGLDPGEDHGRAMQLAMVEKNQTARRTLENVTTPDLMHLLRRKLRTKVAGGPGEAMRMWKHLRLAARSPNNVLIYSEFARALDNLSIPLSPAQQRAVFAELDHNNSGDIDIMELVASFGTYAATLKLPSYDGFETGTDGAALALPSLNPAAAARRVRWRASSVRIPATRSAVSVALALIVPRPSCPPPPAPPPRAV